MFIDEGITSNDGGNMTVAGRWTERNVRGILQHRAHPPSLEGQTTPPRWQRVVGSQSLHTPVDMQALLRLFADVHTLDRNIQKKLLVVVEHNYCLLQRFLDRFQRQDTDKPCEQAIFLARSLKTRSEILSVIYCIPR